MYNCTCMLFKVRGRGALPKYYWILDMVSGLDMVEMVGSTKENYCCITTIDSQQATLRLICYIGFFVSKKVHFKFSSTMVVLLYFRTAL